MRRILIVAILGCVALILWVVRERAQQPEGAPPAAVVAAVRAPDELALVTESIPARDAIGAEPAAEPIVATVDSGAKHRLHGVVRPAVGRKELLSNIAVGATDVWGQAQSTYCLHGGSYAFENLLPGRYWLHISSLQNGRSDAVVDVFGDTTHDFQLSTIELEIRVVDEIGKPSAVLGLLAVATAEEPGEWMDELRGGFSDPIALGRFIRPLWPASTSVSEVLGRLYLERAPPLYVSLCRYQRVLETRRIEPRTEVVRFVLRSDDERIANGSIRVRAVDTETAEAIPKFTGLAEGPASRMSSAQAGVCEF